MPSRWTSQPWRARWSTCNGSSSTWSPRNSEKCAPSYCYQDVAAVADAASATSPNQEETTNLTSHPLILICPLALLLAEAAIAQHQSDSHPVIINAIYGSWDERWALAASDNDSHTLTISDGYNLCGSATSFTSVGSGYIAGSTGAPLASPSLATT